jgi:hypothetical protein
MNNMGGGMIDGSGTINPAALNSGGKIPRRSAHSKLFDDRYGG